ncbi:MAG: peptidase S41, partial [Muribaculaceae bacterium]|nr:peptidase S41 [Muribaculaceae bacterium]
NHTFSAAESFTIDLKESGYVTLVGEKTAGDTGCAPKNFTSKYGIWFRIPTRDPHFSPKGFLMEGVSVEPNHEVKQTVADFFDNKDTVIEYVLNELIHAK